MPYVDPFGGALRGIAAVTSANADYQLTIQNARLAQKPNGPRRVGTKLVGEQQRADRSSLDRDEDDERRSPRGAPDR